MTAADVKFELWLGAHGEITGKFTAKNQREFTAKEWELMVGCVQNLIWTHEKYLQGSQEEDAAT